MNESEEIITQITAQGILPLFYNHSAEASYQVVKALYTAGIRVIEYTARGSESLKNFTSLNKRSNVEMPGLVLGIGTIRTVDEARAFIAAGARFVVSPIFDATLASFMKDGSILWIPGTMTPSEIHSAQVHGGASLIKIFPAAGLGPGFIGSLKEIFPALKFIPTGGIEVSEKGLESWFKAGAAAIGIGSALISKKLMDEENYEELLISFTTTLARIKSLRSRI